MNTSSDWIISVREFYKLVAKAEFSHLSTFIYGSDQHISDPKTTHTNESNRELSQYHGVAVIDASYNTQNTQSPLPFSFVMDIDQVACSVSRFAHTVPKPSQFKEWAETHGIYKDTHVIVYSGDKTYTACRAAWMFSLFGYEHVSVLDGGVEEWSGFAPLDQNKSVPPALHSFSMITDPPPECVDFFLPLLSNISIVYRNITTKHYQVVDARSADRFAGIASSGPRGKEVSGSIPGSVNVPYLSLLDNTGKFLPREKLRTIFDNAGINVNGSIICTCGSGVTACVLFIALKLIDAQDVSVFDGSWQEWSSHEDYPIITASTTSTNSAAIPVQ